MWRIEFLKKTVLKDFVSIFNDNLEQVVHWSREEFRRLFVIAWSMAYYLNLDTENSQDARDLQESLSLNMSTQVSWTCCIDMKKNWCKWYFVWYEEGNSPYI